MKYLSTALLTMLLTGCVSNDTPNFDKLTDQQKLDALILVLGDHHEEAEEEEPK
jgi:hypothetical protein